MTNPNEPAFPILANTLAAVPSHGCSGLSKREHFAAMALNGLLSDESASGCQTYTVAAAATRAIEMADELIHQLSTTHPEARK